MTYQTSIQRGNLNVLKICILIFWRTPVRLISTKESMECDSGKTVSNIQKHVLQRNRLFSIKPNGNLSICIIECVESDVLANVIPLTRIEREAATAD
jgi:hypothetical protein